MIKFFLVAEHWILGGSSSVRIAQPKDRFWLILIKNSAISSLSRFTLNNPLEQERLPWAGRHGVAVVQLQLGTVNYRPFLELKPLFICKFWSMLPETIFMGVSLFFHLQYSYFNRENEHHLSHKITSKVDWNNLR